MQDNPNQSASPMLQIIDNHVVAHYNKKTGQIAHLQVVTVYAGGHEVSAEDAMETAVENATRLGINTALHGVLASKDLGITTAPHVVNLKTKEFTPFVPKDSLSKTKKPVRKAATKAKRSAKLKIKT
jgi:hypothetical protein